MNFRSLAVGTGLEVDELLMEDSGPADVGTDVVGGGLPPLGSSGWEGENELCSLYSSRTILTSWRVRWPNVMEVLRPVDGRVILEEPVNLTL